ncbi:hypothetical protein WJX73_004776 [Symbiochloris irregularis]|uniref:Uncharacterized protein n=1 Tax=Symbiochloris irregularis TaxID=706552 RepID=A0AAW1P835_9CHLO
MAQEAPDLGPLASAGIRSSVVLDAPGGFQDLQRVVQTQSKIRFDPSPSKVNEAQPIRFEEARKPRQPPSGQEQGERDQLLSRHTPTPQALPTHHQRTTHLQQEHMQGTPPGSPTIAAHRMPPLSPIEAQAPAASPLSAAAAHPRVKPQPLHLPPTPSGPYSYPISHDLPAAELSPSPMGQRARLQDGEANQEADGVSLWGDSTIAANARSECSPGLSQRNFGGFESSPDAQQRTHGEFQPLAGGAQYPRAEAAEEGVRQAAVQPQGMENAGDIDNTEGMRALRLGSMAQVLQSLEDSPTKIPIRPPDRSALDTSTRARGSPAVPMLLRPNPLYGQERDTKDMAEMGTPESMLGSNSASNEMGHSGKIPRSGATIKSVSGRPWGNPLFDPRDDASRYEVRV